MVSLDRIPALVSDDTFNVVIETPRGSGLKLKYEPAWNLMVVSRPLILGVTYPFDWGFIPSTKEADGDALDAILLWDNTSYPGVVIQCRAIGSLSLEQNRHDHDSSQRIRNDRILAVPRAARRQCELLGLGDLSNRVREEIEQFALVAAALEGKDVRIVGWGDSTSALNLVRASVTGGR